MTPARRFAFLVFLGAILMQTAWIVAVPPFRGSDEFDHAYRAASVADGVWMPTTPAPDGRGDLVPVSPALVAAAQPVCLTYLYVGPDNCYPVSQRADGTVLIATAGSRYNPAFYVAVGLPAKPFDGAPALYVMRLAGSLLTALLLGLAGWVVASSFTSIWPRLGLVLAVTPVVAYSDAIPASNGSEMISGLGLWCCLLAIGANLARPRHVRRLIMTSIPFAVLLADLRSTGPLYVAIVVVTSAFALGATRIRRLWGEHRRLLVLAAVPVALAGAFNLWWMRERPITDLLVPGHYPHPVAYAFEQIPLWVMQSIGAFPIREQPAPAAVYGAYGLLLLAFCVAGFVVAGRRLRTGMGLAVLASIAVPVFFTATTYATYGSIWQGRYGLAVSVGVIMLAAVSLDATRPVGQRIPMLLGVGWLLIGFSHVASLLKVLMDEDAHSPLAGDARWVSHPAWVVVSLAVLACLTWAWAVHGGASSSSRDDVERATGDQADTGADVDGEARLPAWS